MGGKGSGGYRWGRRRVTVEKCIALDVNWLARHKLFTNPGRLTFHWGQSVVGAAAFNPESCEMTLVFEIDENRLIDQRVGVTSSRCHYGGSRIWFECPWCRKRVAKLYLPRNGVSQLQHASGFACRNCWALSYQVRNVRDPCEVAIRRAWRVKERLGATRSPLGRFPTKAKWMRWRTYDRHANKFDLAMKQLNEELIFDFAKRFPEIFVENLPANGGPQLKRRFMSEEKDTRRRIERDYFSVLADAITEAVWREIVERTISDAKKGDPKARDWIARFALGKDPMSLMDLARLEGLGIQPEHEIAAMVDMVKNPPEPDPILKSLGVHTSDTHLERALRLAKAQT